MDSQLSKSERKRRAKGIEQLVNELALLAESEIGSLPCEHEIKEEILAAKSLKGGAKKRQLKYATKLLRDKPLEELYDFLARRKGSHLKQKREFHELENLRNLLVNEAVQLYDDAMDKDGYMNENEPIDLLQNSEAIDEIVGHFPQIDQMQLRNLAIQFARTRNRKFSRELFRVLKAAQEKTYYS